MVADVVGYSRLMGRDDAGTLARLKACRHELLEPLVSEHRGRIINFPGDNALCEFASVVDAVECAVTIQRGVAEREREVPRPDRIAFRIGVNLADILAEERGLYGDGHPTTPTRPLATHGPATFTVESDPLGLCDNSMTFDGDSRSERLQGEFQIGSSVAYELQSPLVRLLPASIAGGLVGPPRADQVPEGHGPSSFDQDAPLEDGGVASAGPTPVTIGVRT